MGEKNIANGIKTALRQHISHIAINHVKAHGGQAVALKTKTLKHVCNSPLLVTIRNSDDKRRTRFSLFITAQSVQCKLN